MMEVKIEGIEALSKRLEGMKYEAQRAGGRFALRKAAQVVRDAAKKNAMRINDPQTSEEIFRNITERWGSRYNKRTGDLMFRVGVLGGVFGKLNGDVTGSYGSKFTKATRARGAISSGPGGDTRHWGYVEFGTEKMAAQPFLRPALEQNIPQVTRVFITEWNKSIDRAIKKAGK